MPPLSVVQWENWALTSPARTLNLGWNGVRAILIHMWRCSLVSLERYIVLIMFIVEKAASQLYVDPNMVRMNRATFLKPGKAVSETIWSQKVAGCSAKLLFQSYICLQINQSQLERPSIYTPEVLCDFFWEPPDICDEKWVLNEHGELLSKAEAVKAFAEIYN